MVCRPGRRGHGWVCGHSDAFRRRPQCGHPSLAHRPRCGPLGTVGSDKVSRAALEWLASLEAHRLCTRPRKARSFPKPGRLRARLAHQAEPIPLEAPERSAVKLTVGEHLELAAR